MYKNSYTFLSVKIKVSRLNLDILNSPVFPFQQTYKFDILKNVCYKVPVSYKMKSKSKSF